MIEEMKLSINDCHPICARISCPNYDKEAEKLTQYCSYKCAPKDIDAPGFVVERSTSFERTAEKIAAKLNKDGMGIMNECPKCGEHSLSLSLWTDGSYRCPDCGHKLTPHTAEDAASCLSPPLTTSDMIAIEEDQKQIKEEEDKLCIFCHSVPCDGKSLYCSPECHSAYLRGSEAHKDRYCPEKMCAGRPPMVREEDTVTGTCWRCACGRLYLLMGGGLICVKQPEGVKHEEIVFQAPGHPPQIDIDGILSTPGLSHHLVPLIVTERRIKRYMLGQVRKGPKAWNAMAPAEIQEGLKSKLALLTRLSHAIDHANKLIHKVIHDLPFDDDDDAAAISWAGDYAIAATDAIEKERNCQHTASPFKTVSQTTSKELSGKQPLSPTQPSSEVPLTVL